jgi:hypothetical protein
MPKADLNQALYSIEQLADILQISPKTLRNNRCNHPERVPPAIKVGGKVLWHPLDVEKWLNNLSRSASSRPRKVGRPPKTPQRITHTPDAME